MDPGVGTEEFAPCSQAVRELVIWIPARRCNDRKDEDPALAEQFVVSVRVALAERFGYMGEVEFARRSTYERGLIARRHQTATVSSRTQ
jgi:hypothetical protein